jgi:hypothetical protein
MIPVRASFDIVSHVESWRTDHDQPDEVVSHVIRITGNEKPPTDAEGSY